MQFARFKCMKRKEEEKRTMQLRRVFVSIEGFICRNHSNSGNVHTITTNENNYTAREKPAADLVK